MVEKTVLMQEVCLISMVPECRVAGVLTIPCNKVVFWLKAPYMLWFLGVKDAIKGRSVDGVKILRWWAVEGAWRMMIDNYKIRKD